MTRDDPRLPEIRNHRRRRRGRYVRRVLRAVGRPAARAQRDSREIAERQPRDSRETAEIAASSSSGPSSRRSRCNPPSLPPLSPPRADLHRKDLARLRAPHLHHLAVCPAPNHLEAAAEKKAGQEAAARQSLEARVVRRSAVCLTRMLAVGVLGVSDRWSTFRSWKSEV